MACEQNFQLGINAKLYYGDCDDAIGVMTEASNVRDVSVDLGANTTDITTRANAGWI